MEEQRKNFINERIKHLKQLIGKLQLADQVNDTTYKTATSQLLALYEVANG